jgi:hypothetical protein
MTASSTVVLTNLAYLIGAVVLATIGGLIVWWRHRQPRSIYSDVESFHRGLQALAPDASRSGANRTTPVASGGVRIQAEPVAAAPDGMTTGELAAVSVLPISPDEDPAAVDPAAGLPVATNGRVPHEAPDQDGQAGEPGARVEGERVARPAGATMAPPPVSPDRPGDQLDPPRVYPDLPPPVHPDLPPPVHPDLRPPVHPDLRPPVHPDLAVATMVMPPVSPDLPGDRPGPPPVGPDLAGPAFLPSIEEEEEEAGSEHRVAGRAGVEAG